MSGVGGFGESAGNAVDAPGPAAVRQPPPAWRLGLRVIDDRRDM